MSDAPKIVPDLVYSLKGVGAGFSEVEGRIQDITLDVAVGERVAILGISNADRALLLRVLAGLRPIRFGQMSVMGQTLEKLPYWADWDQIMPQSVRRRLGVCLEHEGLLNNVSVREGLELLFRFKYGDHNEKLRDGAAKIVTTTCAKFGLDAAIDKRPYLLNGAEKRLAGLSRAFLSKPPVVVLENPSQNIGDSHRDRLWKAFDFMCAQSERTILLSTDDWAIAHHFCPKRWIVMDGGSISFDGPPKEFLQKADHPLIQQLKSLEHIQVSYKDLRQEDVA
jgi:ABC-type multidrug transport system ATPase subunit